MYNSLLVDFQLSFEAIIKKVSSHFNDIYLYNVVVDSHHYQWLISQSSILTRHIQHAALPLLLNLSSFRCQRRRNACLLYLCTIEIRSLDRQPIKYIFYANFIWEIPILSTIHDVIYTPAEGQDLSEMHLKKILINVNKWRSQPAWKAWGFESCLTSLP